MLKQAESREGSGTDLLTVISLTKAFQCLQSKASASQTEMSRSPISLSGSDFPSFSLDTLIQKWCTSVTMSYSGWSLKNTSCTFLNPRCYPCCFLYSKGFLLTSNSDCFNFIYLAKAFINFTEKGKESLYLTHIMYLWHTCAYMLWVV